MSGVDVSSLPPSDGCILDEIQVFIPVFQTPTSFSFGIFTEHVSFIVPLIGGFGLVVVADCFLHGERGLARFLSAVCLMFVWLNYFWGSLLVLCLTFLLVSLIERHDSADRNIPDDIRFQNRLIISSFVALLAFTFVFS